MRQSPLDVLVIDDCAEDREVIQSALLAIRDQRYSVREAGTAAEGLRLAAESKPDCVLLDYRLPDADGLHLLQQYAQQASVLKCPIVLMTGATDARISTAALLQGAQDFLAKQEITAGLLERVIQNAIVRFRLTEERTQAMNGLAEREALLRMAQEIAGIGTFDWQLPTGATRFGGAYFELYGFPPASPPFSFQEWLERIHPDDRDRIKNMTAGALESGRDFSYEYRVVWPDGTLHWLLARGAVIRSESGKPVRLTGVNIDVTAVKSAEEALVVANQELQQFALTAGHDLQAPLRTISVFADLLEKTLAPSSNQNIQQAITQVRSGSQRMRMLVGALLEYAQSGSPFGGARHAPLQELLQHALENLASDIEASGAKVTWGEPPPVACFGKEFVQVFQNLISNGIKYGRTGVPPAIHVTCIRQSDEWVVAIRDNGRGVDMRHRDLIFQPFKRLVGQEIAGTGLGLPICKRIVDRNGGRIWIESTPGIGSRFFFAVPIADTKMSPEGRSANNLCRSSVA